MQDSHNTNSHNVTYKHLSVYHSPKDKLRFLKKMCKLHNLSHYARESILTLTMQFINTNQCITLPMTNYDS